MNAWKQIRQSLITSVWFMFLTFPIMVIKVNTIEDSIEWRWKRLVLVGIGAFVLSFVWRWALERKQRGAKNSDFLGRLKDGSRKKPAFEEARPDKKGKTVAEFFRQKLVMYPGLGIIGVFIVVFPFITSMYQTNILSTALMYVVLGLGLNIVVGLGGLLHLGYIAFYAFGAYTYALLNSAFGLNFWICLPLGGMVSLLLGFILGIIVLRLRGDYLAIVTLAFGEITRIVLENWNKLSKGPSGIANIPRPGFMGLDLNLQQSTVYIYFLMVLLAVLTIFIVIRLKSSRLGRAWEAMREDDIASQAMGINLTKSKLTSFALGAFWAGLVGVMFAAKTTFINPASFTVWESILVLCIVVLGGMGSTVGVVIGAFALILLPEYLRAFSEFRMLLFGAILVVMMIFRPGGLVRARRHVFTINIKDAVMKATEPKEDA
jgi:branched-chain amino acid transport system permease protein